MFHTFGAAILRQSFFFFKKNLSRVFRFDVQNTFHLLRDSYDYIYIYRKKLIRRKETMKKIKNEILEKEESTRNNKDNRVTVSIFITNNESINSIAVKSSRSRIHYSSSSLSSSVAPCHRPSVYRNNRRRSHSTLFFSSLSSPK